MTKDQLKMDLQFIRGMIEAGFLIHVSNQNLHMDDYFASLQESHDRFIKDFDTIDNNKTKINIPNCS